MVSRRTSPAVEAAILVAMLAIGALLGLGLGHAFAASSTSTISDTLLEAVRAYGGAATFVGFGLVNRMLRSSMFVVPIGAPIAWLVVLGLSSIVGYVTLPFVIAWRLGSLLRLRPRARESVR